LITGSNREIEGLWFLGLLVVVVAASDDRAQGDLRSLASIEEIDAAN
jgi:hypothetical protein